MTVCLRLHQQIALVCAMSAGTLATGTATAAHGAETIDVDTAAELAEALANAAPGDVIQLAGGTYDGQFVISVDGTAGEPITLRGPRTAVLDGGDNDDGYGLHLDDADHWRLAGFTITNSQKGVMADNSDHSVIDGLYVHDIGEEGIHLRTHSSGNVVRNSRVTDTGLAEPRFGEAIYVGSAVSNWDTYTGGKPDRSDRNRVVNNILGPYVSAEHIDVKEGTRGGVVRGNIFDGRGMRGADYNDSWMDVKGNGYLIKGNVGTYAAEDGFQTHVEVEGWGRANVFTGNYADVRGPGYGFSVHTDCPDDATCGNVVYDDNVVLNAESGYANIPVTPADRDGGISHSTPPAGTTHWHC